MKKNYESLKVLHDIIKKGDTVYTVLRHVSRSGMQRRIDAYVIKDNIPRWISYHVANVTGYKVHRDKQGITINSCGMDMGFNLVYNLSMAMFCPDKYDHDSAYALKQEWL